MTLWDKKQQICFKFEQKNQQEKQKKIAFLKYISFFLQYCINVVNAHVKNLCV